MPQREQFFETIFGDGHFYWCSYKEPLPKGDKQKLIKQGFCATPALLAQRIERNTSNNISTHVGLSNYNPIETNRKQCPVVHRRVVVLDFDYKDQDEFDNPVDFYEALMQALPLEPTAVTQSGGGCHVYYSIQQDVQRVCVDLYHHINEHFITLPYNLDPRAGHTLHDTVRAFESFNYKRPTEFQVVATQWTGTVYSLPDFCHAFSIKYPIPARPEPVARVTRSQAATDVNSRMLRAIQRSNPPPPTAVVQSACGAFALFLEKSRNAFDNGTAGGYPDVRMACNIFNNTNVKVNEAETFERQRDAAVTVLSRHPLGEEDWITEQYIDVHENYGAPYSCDKWGAAFQGPCNKCKYRGIVHGPIQAGLQFIVEHINRPPPRTKAATSPASVSDDKPKKIAAYAGTENATVPVAHEFKDSIAYNAPDTTDYEEWEDS